MTTARFETLGRTLRVSCSDHGILNAIRHRWSAFAPRKSTGTEDHQIDMDALLTARRAPITPRIGANIYLHEVARIFFPDYLFFHATLIISSAGRAALVVGASGSGKTTIASLARAFGLVAPADDLVALDREGCARALPIPSAMRPITSRFLSELGLAPIAAALKPLGQAVRPGIVFLLNPVSESATAGLFANSFNAWCPGRDVFLRALLRRLEGIPVRQYEPLDLADRAGRELAISTARQIFASLGS